jgi:hypothetical protein
MREDFQQIIHKKDKLISDEQRKSSEIRELCDTKLLELKSGFLELQKDNSGLKDINSLLRSQISQAEKERDKQMELVFSKDKTIDKLKEELILLNRSISQNSVTNKADNRDYEEKSAVEFTRLKGLIEELKNSQIEIERVKMENVAKDREYLKLKEQTENTLDEKNDAMRQLDVMKFENQKLKDEQDRFVKELDDIRDIYESQIDNLTSKLHLAADQTIKSKAKTSELQQENNMLKIKAEDGRKRVAGRDVEIEKLTSHNLFELGGMFKLKPTELLTSPSMLKVSLENDSIMGGGSPERNEDHLKFTERPKTRTEIPSKDNFMFEDKMKLEWDSLLHRISSIGTK